MVPPSKAKRLKRCPNVGTSISTGVIVKPSSGSLVSFNTKYSITRIANTAAIVALDIAHVPIV